MIELKPEDSLMEHTCVSKIKANLDRIFGKDEWIFWEIETITLGLGVVLSDLLRDKIHVAQLMAQNPKLFTDDAMFFLHATDVMNGHTADFESAPLPTSLELAYSLMEAKRILPNYIAPQPGEPIADICLYILREEGFSEPVAPFQFLPKEALEPGQTPEDTADKVKAINQYWKAMEAA